MSEKIIQEFFGKIVPNVIATANRVSNNNKQAALIYAATAGEPSVRLRVEFISMSMATIILPESSKIEKQEYPVSLDATTDMWQKGWI